MNIKPIETQYRGYRFRSRLEARWAVFFDTLGLEWVYENEGYVLPSGVKYLPDFYVKGIGFIETKGGYPSEDEQSKCESLCLSTEENVYIFFGEIPDTVDDNCIEFRDDGPAIAILYRNAEETCVLDGSGFGEPCHTEILPSFTWDIHYMWCRCSKCGKVGIEFEGRAGRICKHSNDDKGYNFDDQLINKAAKKSRGARFEHGESG